MVQLTSPKVIHAKNLVYAKAGFKEGIHVSIFKTINLIVNKAKQHINNEDG